MSLADEFVSRYTALGGTYYVRKDGRITLVADREWLKRDARQMIVEIGREALAEAFHRYDMQYDRLMEAVDGR